MQQNRIFGSFSYSSIFNRSVSKLNKTSSYTYVLTSVELHEAEMLWILFVQWKATLESRQTKNLQRQLGTFSDECEVIR
jgi:hypothetical protein